MENILLPFSSTSHFNLTKVEELLTVMELNQLKTFRPWQLSLGERARAALLRALLLEPKYLLLDEATAALDLDRSKLVGTLLRSAAENGTGVLVVTHDLEFALSVSDRSFRLDKGRLFPNLLQIQGGPLSPKFPSLNSYR